MKIHNIVCTKSKYLDPIDSSNQQHQHNQPIQITIIIWLHNTHFEKNKQTTLASEYNRPSGQPSSHWHDFGLNTRPGSIFFYLKKYSYKIRIQIIIKRNLPQAVRVVQVDVGILHEQAPSVLTNTPFAAEHLMTAASIETPAKSPDTQSLTHEQVESSNRKPAALHANTAALARSAVNAHGAGTH